jgi:hypothetical protein
LVNQIAQLFYKSVEEQSKFLVAEYSFLGPFTDINIKESSLFNQVWYLGKNVAIEFHLELKDQDISCMIAQLTNGKRPEMWTKDYKYNQRAFLEIWCDWKGLQRKQFPKFPGLCFEEKIPKLIDFELSVIKESGQEILEDEAEILKDMPDFISPVFQ